jgi:transposase
MAKVNDLSRSLAALDQDTTLIAVVELSSKKWLVGAAVPGARDRALPRAAPQDPT